MLEKLKKLNEITVEQLAIFAKGAMFGAFAVVGASIAAYLLGWYY